MARHDAADGRRPRRAGGHVLLIVTERRRAELASVGACGVLLLARVLRPEEVFPLFASEAVVTAGAMFVLSAALARTGVIETARLLGADPRPFVIGVALGASACFATPIGYQTNTLVFSAGGCRFADFLRVGLPLNLIHRVLASLLVPLFWPLH